MFRGGQGGGGGDGREAGGELLPILNALLSALPPLRKKSGACRERDTRTQRKSLRQKKGF